MKELDALTRSFFDSTDFTSLPSNYAEREFEKENVNQNCALVFIKNNQPTIHSPEKHHDRLKDFEYCLNIFCENQDVKDFKFLVVLNDGMRMDVPSLSPNRLQRKWFNNIPIPMGNRRGLQSGCGTPMEGWDEYIKDRLLDSHNSYPWNIKFNQAVFRGQFSQQTYALGGWGTRKAKKWTEVTRGVLYNKFKNNKLFDIGFHKSNKKEVPTTNSIPFVDQQQYKYILSVGTNVDWAERLRLHFFTNSVTVIHGAECIEWFYPLLKPYYHYIPTDIFFNDLEDNIKWALNNDDSCQQIVRNANSFAKKYLSEDAMHYAFNRTLKHFSTLS